MLNKSWGHNPYAVTCVEHIPGVSSNDVKCDVCTPKKTKEPEPNLHTCGYPEDSFACKVRHLSMNSGAANAKRDYEQEQQVRKYGV